MRRWTLRLPWLAAGLIAAGALAWLSRDPRIPYKAFEEYSIYNTSPGGLSLASRYLASSGRTVQPLTRPVERAFLPADGVLFRIRPEADSFKFPVPEEKAVNLRPRNAWELIPPAAYAFTAEEEEWVRNGGRLVLAVDKAYGSIAIQESGGAPPRKVFPLWPGVARLEPPAGRVFRDPPAGGGVSVFAAGDRPVIVRDRRGRGEIILCSTPELFQNGHLGGADHLALLDRLAEPGRPVFFDEHVHGIQGEAGMLEILRQWGFGPFLVTVVLAALASFWRRRVRIGPEEDDARETRVEAVDFVDSLSQLYRRMLPRRQSLALYAKAFEKAVSAQTGLEGAALETRVREYLPARPPRPVRGKDLPLPEFAVELERINLAFRRLSDAKRPGDRRAVPAGARPA